MPNPVLYSVRSHNVIDYYNVANKVDQT